MTSTQQTIVNVGKLPFSPIWLDGVISSDYELDTLPLIFASDKEYDVYYDALIEKHKRYAHHLTKIRKVNTAARAYKAAGNFSDCLTLLNKCLHDRRALFEDLEYQFYAALIHYLLSIIYFASMNLATGNSRSAYALFSLGLKELDEYEYLLLKSDRNLLCCILNNNLANYWFRRGKVNAASQCCCRAYQLWMRISDLSNNVIAFLSPYLIARFTTSLLLSEKVDDAIKVYSKFLKVLPPDGKEDGPDKEKDAIASSPSSSNPPTDATQSSAPSPIPPAEAGGSSTAAAAAAANKSSSLQPQPTEDPSKINVNITTLSLIDHDVEAPSKCCLRSLSLSLTPVLKSSTDANGAESPIGNASSVAAASTSSSKVSSRKSASLPDPQLLAATDWSLNRAVKYTSVYNFAYAKVVTRKYKPAIDLIERAAALFNMTVQQTAIPGNPLWWAQLQKAYSYCWQMTDERTLEDYKMKPEQTREHALNAYQKVMAQVAHRAHLSKSVPFGSRSTSTGAAAAAADSPLPPLRSASASAILNSEASPHKLDNEDEHWQKLLLNYSMPPRFRSDLKKIKEAGLQSIHNVVAQISNHQEYLKFKRKELEISRVKDQLHRLEDDEEGNGMESPSPTSSAYSGGGGGGLKIGGGYMGASPSPAPKYILKKPSLEKTGESVFLRQLKDLQRQRRARQEEMLFRPTSSPKLLDTTSALITTAQKTKARPKTPQPHQTHEVVPVDPDSILDDCLMDFVVGEVNMTVPSPILESSILDSITGAGGGIADSATKAVPSSPTSPLCGEAGFDADRMPGDKTEALERQGSAGSKTKKKKKKIVKKTAGGGPVAENEPPTSPTSPVAEDESHKVDYPPPPMTPVAPPSGAADGATADSVAVQGTDEGVDEPSESEYLGNLARSYTTGKKKGTKASPTKLLRRKPLLEDEPDLVKQRVKLRKVLGFLEPHSGPYNMVVDELQALEVKERHARQQQRKAELEQKKAEEKVQKAKPKSDGTKLTRIGPQTEKLGRNETSLLTMVMIMSLALAQNQLTAAGGTQEKTSPSGPSSRPSSGSSKKGTEAT